MIQEIMSNVKVMQDRIAELRRKSDYWPEIYVMSEPTQDGNTQLFVSTLVRVYRRKKWYQPRRWYVVHCVDDQTLHRAIRMEDVMVFKLLAFKAHVVQQLWRLTDYDKLDKYQIPEAERLAKRYPYLYRTKYRE